MNMEIDYFRRKLSNFDFILKNSLTRQVPLGICLTWTLFMIHQDAESTWHIFLQSLLLVDLGEFLLVAV